MSRTSTVGLSRRQRVFAVLDATMGSFTWPSATADFIRPAGNAVINQKPAFVNSEELADTLDILDQFQNATPAGDFTLKMYIRPSGTIGNAPQGAALFKALQGSTNATTTATLLATLSTTSATATIQSISGGTFPHCGSILIGTESISYANMIQTISTKATLTGCTRGYNSTTPASHATAAGAVSLKSIFYKQAATSPTFTLWIESDHFVQALSGGSVVSAAIDVTNDGGLLMTFTGQGMQMKWAGTDALVHKYATAATQVMVTNAKLFCPDMRIYDSTKNEYATTGYKVIASNATTNVLRLSPALASNWASADFVKGYLPTGTVIGTPLEARKTQSAIIQGTVVRMKKCTLSIGTPKQYLTDEIGATAPEDFLENVRNISTTLNLYFRKADAQYFKRGYDGNEGYMRLPFGETAGSIMEIYFKRMKLQVPDVNFNPPAVELNVGATALGTVGEDSCEIIFR